MKEFYLNSAFLMHRIFRCRVPDVFKTNIINCWHLYPDCLVPVESFVFLLGSLGRDCRALNWETCVLTACIQLTSLWDTVRIRWLLCLYADFWISTLPIKLYLSVFLMLNVILWNWPMPTLHGKCHKVAMLRLLYLICN